MKTELYRKIFNYIKEDLNMILSDDDFEEPEIDLGVHIQNIQTKCSPQYIIQDAINNKDTEELRNLINNWSWDGKTALYPVNDNNIKDAVRFSIKALGDNANLNWIDTSNVTDMSKVFDNSRFNGDISKWDVSNVVNMLNMFRMCKFNGDISSWDVSNVTNMYSMFFMSKFNGDISQWNVSSVTNMSYMFDYSVFNGDISSWDVSSVTDMIGMFYKSIFNGDISGWDVSNVKNKQNMFLGCPIKQEYKPKFNYLK